MESGHNGERRLSYIHCSYNTNIRYIPTMVLVIGSMTRIQILESSKQTNVLVHGVRQIDQAR